jgi:hypothetical protein
VANSNVLENKAIDDLRQCNTGFNNNVHLMVNRCVYDYGSDCFLKYFLFRNILK